MARRARWCLRGTGEGVPAGLVMSLAAALAPGCSAPVLGQDGQLVFAPGGQRGATVITANGVEFIDRKDVPAAVIRRSANDPWRPATGFLLPSDGVWRKMSSPVAVQGHGLAVILRTSDVLVPSWGGEILLRMDAVAPARAYPKAAVRAPIRLVVVLDGHDANTAPLVDTALDALGEKDRAGVADSLRWGRERPQTPASSDPSNLARAVLPMIPGSNQTLLRAAVDRVVDQGARTEAAGLRRPGATAARDLAGALALARRWLSQAPAAVAPLDEVGPPGAPPGPSPVATRRVLVVTDGLGVALGGARVAREAQELRAEGVVVTAVGSVDQLDAAALASLGGDVHAGTPYQEREDAVAAAVPPPGDVALEDVTLSISSTPAPAHVLELSSGDRALALDADRMHLGDLSVGEARTEVARVALPTWVPGEPLELTVTATYRVAGAEEVQRARTSIRCKYSNDVSEIAGARHGDVIAYASALAMVRRLDRAFAGSSVDRLGGLRPIVTLQARSLQAMALVDHDPALGAQAEILETLLGVLDD